MILSLPSELKANIFLYLNSFDLMNLSYTCKSLRQDVLGELRCETCHHLKKAAAICHLNECNKLICESCFEEHFFDHLTKVCPSTLDFNITTTTKVIDNVYTFTVDDAYAYNGFDYTDSDEENEDDLSFIFYLGNEEEEEESFKDFLSGLISRQPN